MRLLKWLTAMIFTLFSHAAVVVKYPDGFLKSRIPYAITDQIEKWPIVKACVLKAMEHVSNNSCVQFVQQNTHVTSSKSGYLLIDSHKSEWTCTSSLGLKDGNPTLLQFGATCGTKVKECVRTLLRAIGFEREHLREERGRYVTLDDTPTSAAAVTRRRADGLAAFGRRTLQSNTVRQVTPYDISSIMHFDATDVLNYGNRYAIRTRLAIVDQSLGNTLRGDTHPLSFRDRSAINDVFKCSAKCPNITCQFEGYVDKTCECVCPYGLSGKYCERLRYSRHFKLPSCGIITAKASGSIISPNYPKQYPRGTFCQWVLKTPKAWQKIEFRLIHFDLEHEDALLPDKCHDTLRIWPHGTTVATKKLSCFPDDRLKYKKDKYITQNNWMMVEFRSNNLDQFNHTGFKIDYRLIDERKLEKSEAQSDSGEVRGSAGNKALGELKALVDSATQLYCYSCVDRQQCNASMADVRSHATRHCDRMHACSTTYSADGRVEQRGCMKADRCIAQMHNGCNGARCTRCCAHDICNMTSDGHRLTSLSLLAAILAFFGLRSA